MDKVTFPDAVLVATDFSTSARRALDTALSWRQPSTEVTLLHVVDTELAERVESHGVAARAEAVARMRARAEEQLVMLKQDYAPESFESMIVEGIPFVEIVRLANDLVISLIIVGRYGNRASIEGVLFGSTAEKVVRSARIPVLCVP